MSRIGIALAVALLALPLMSAMAAEDEVLDLVANPDKIKDVELPRLQDAMAFYPFEAQEAGERGQVKLTFVVRTDGSVSDVRIDVPSRYWRLNDAAVASMLSRSYEPATRQGVPIAVRIWAIDNFNPDPNQPEVDNPLDAEADLKLSCRYGSHHIAVDACSALLDAGKAQARYVLYPRAHAYEELGQYDKALADYDRLVGFRPDAPDLYVNRGFSREALGQYDKAAADYDHAVTLDPRNVTALFDRGFAHERAGTSAATDFAAALEARPKCKTEETRGIGTQWKQGPWSGKNTFNPDQPGMADASSFNQSPANGPGEHFGPDPATVAHYEHNNKDTTIGTQTKVVVQTVCKASWVPDLAAIPDIDTGTPDEMQRREFRCWARAVSNKWLDAALTDCTRALALNPGFVRAYDTRGLVHMRKGDNVAALKDFDTALDKNPRLASALYGRGLVKRRTGDMKGSQADIFAARAIDPEIASTYSRYDISP